MPWPLVLLACSKAGDSGPVVSETSVCHDADPVFPTGFCEALDDGGSVQQHGEGDSLRGVIVVRLLTDQSDAVTDPVYVAFKSYTLESAHTRIQGETSGDGMVLACVASGDWFFEAAPLSRGDETCTAELEIPVGGAETTSFGCAVMSCESAG